MRNLTSPRISIRTGIQSRKHPANVVWRRATSELSLDWARHRAGRGARHGMAWHRHGITGSHSYVHETTHLPTDLYSLWFVYTTKVCVTRLAKTPRSW